MIQDICMDQHNLRILDALQEDFPLTHEPWEEIGAAIGLSGEEVLKRVQHLSRSGVIRSIAPSLDSTKRRNRVSTLIALQVPDDRIGKVAVIINEYPEVSHNFRRESQFNLWFTLSAYSNDNLDALIDDILKNTGINPDSLLNLITIRSYKIDVRFPLLQNQEDEP